MRLGEMKSSQLRCITERVRTPMAPVAKGRRHFLQAYGSVRFLGPCRVNLCGASGVQHVVGLNSMRESLVLLEVDEKGVAHLSLSLNGMLCEELYMS